MNPPSTSTRATRLATFLRERFPLWPAALGLFLQSAMSLSALAKLSFPEAAQWNSISGPTVLVQSFSIPLMFLLIRIADELKDHEADQRLFPERPLARGAVSLPDLHFLAWLLSAILILLHLTLRWLVPTAELTTMMFVGSMFFIFLMWRWFFFERQIRPSLPLALLTHNPSALLLNLFLLSVLPWHPRLWVFALGAQAAAAAWEIGRKIRPRGTETDYTTYSKIWGPRRSMVITLILCTLALAFQTFPFFVELRAEQRWIFWPAHFGFLVSLTQGLRFLKNPDDPCPKEITAGTSFGILISLLLFLFFADLMVWEAGA